MSDTSELCKWLRINSSGIYRPAADAATIIEEQEITIANLRADWERLRDNRDCEKRLRQDAEERREELSEEIDTLRADVERYKADAERRLALIAEVMDEDDPSVIHTLGDTLCDELRAEIPGRAARGEETS